MTFIIPSSSVHPSMAKAFRASASCWLSKVCRATWSIRGALPKRLTKRPRATASRSPMNLVVEGGKTSLPEMIAGTDRGLLVTRLWYIREVEPYEKIMTGMTRDGLFLVEKGQVTRPVRNFRFNQSILQMLRNVEALGPSHRATAEESFEMVVPPMKIREFHFSEVTKF